MVPEDFTKSFPGKLVPIAPDQWAFIPANLPPTIAWDIALVKRLSDAERAVGSLSGLCAWLPNTVLFSNAFLNREAVLSSRIEGTRATLVDVFAYRAAPQVLSSRYDAADTEEVYNYALALETGLDLLRTLPLSRRLLCEVHKILLDGVRGQEWPAGQFRSIQNMIGTKGDTAKTARFVPPPPGLQLNAALDELERYLNLDSPLPTLIDMALVHYQFETIHPFVDGNGRIGRLLITLMLIDRKILAAPFLYLSGFFERHRIEYQQHLLNVSQKNMWNEWLDFFLRAVIEEANDATTRASALQTLRENYRQQIQQHRSATASLLGAIDYIFAEPVFNTEALRHAIGLSVPATRAVIRALENMNIVVEKTGKQRHQVFVAELILKILEAPSGTAPFPQLATAEPGG